MKRILRREENVEIPVKPHFSSVFKCLCKFEGRAGSHNIIECSVLRRTHSSQVLLSQFLAVPSLHQKGLEQGWDTVSKSTTFGLDIRKGGSPCGKFTYNLPHHNFFVFDNGNFTQ